jgi:rubrerythrin
MGKIYLGTSNHSPSIENEVYKTLFANLAGMMANLRYQEMALLADQEHTKLESYLHIAKSATQIKNNWYKFTDQEIKDMSIPVSTILKKFSADYQHNQLIVQEYYDFLNDLLNNYLNKK